MVMNVPSSWISPSFPAPLSDAFAIIAEKEIGPKDMELLGSLKVGETVCVYSLSIVIRGSWYAAFWRTLQSESKYLTLAWADRVVTYAMEVLCKRELQGPSHDTITDKLWKMKTGVENLSVTYLDDDICHKYFVKLDIFISGLLFDANSIILRYRDTCPVTIHTESLTHHQQAKSAPTFIYDNDTNITTYHFPTSLN